MEMGVWLGCEKKGIKRVARFFKYAFGRSSDAIFFTHIRAPPTVSIFHHAKPHQTIGAELRQTTPPPKLCDGAIG